MTLKDKAAEVEARLHRSLIEQVRVPRLDRRFNAGVWSRIEAQEQEQRQAFAAPARTRKSGSEHWLLVSNVAGIAVASVLVLFFGLRMLSGSDTAAFLSGDSLAQNHQATEIIIWTVTVVSLVFGAMFTPVGRWLRAEFT